jgi:ankyrin repeat protein
MDKRRNTIAVLALCILSALGTVRVFGQSVPAVNPPAVSTPIAVSYQESEDHRIGRQPILRADLGAVNAALLAMVGITVKVTVNPEGIVTSAYAGPFAAPYAGPEDSLTNIRHEAEVAVSEMRYRPFERDGHPIWATFAEGVAVLPPELRPLRHIPFPEVRDWKTVVMTLTRTGCLGSCPSYRVEVHGDGNVVYDGTGSVAVEGKHRCTISQEKVRELVTQFREADYYSLLDEYVANWTDLPTYTSSIEIDGQLKKVTDYAGVQLGMPLKVSDLEFSIDHMSEVNRWTERNANTVPCLQEEKWDFKSSESAQMLVGVAERGTADAVRELVAAGSPLSGQDEMNQTPLMWAARRGDVEMLRTLLEAGAGKKDARGIGAALAMATRFGNNDAMKLLLTFGKTGDLGDGRGQTMLMLAAASGVPKVVKEVLKDDHDVNARDKNGRTALIEAVDHYENEAETSEIDRAWVVRMLLEAGADANLRDEDGNSALIDACWNANVVLALIQGGANINAQNKQGETALINCATAEVAWVLLANHADLSIRNVEGKTALDIAKQDNMKEKEDVLVSGKKP